MLVVVMVLAGLLALWALIPALALFGTFFYAVLQGIF